MVRNLFLSSQQAKLDSSEPAYSVIIRRNLSVSWINFQVPKGRAGHYGGPFWVKAELIPCTASAP